ncbi:MAG: metal-dependent hydrolase [Bdellovibrionales bacterium]|nr:metal-dependent hydrolase [Bdellovibrionales bacterium]
MATQQSHISFSLGVGLLYTLGGIFVLSINPEYALLAGVIIVIAGMLPDVDSGTGVPARELAGLLAAVSPLLILEHIPEVRVGGVARVTLVVVCAYLLTRVLIVRGLQKFASHRGIWHSLPAAIITFELTYLLFWDVFWYDRLYLASAALTGFMLHLLMDAYTNLDLVGQAMGNANKKPPVLKLRGKSMGPTIAMYAGMLYLGYFVARDFYPGIERYARLPF